MYVYNIVEAQNKSVQKNVNLICNMQIVHTKKISASIPTWYGIYFCKNKSFYVRGKIFFIVPPLTKS